MFFQVDIEKTFMIEALCEGFKNESKERVMAYRS